MHKFKKIFNPEVFQGKHKKKNYFEGWYYKIVDKNQQYSFALIPGIAYDKEKNGHAFVQVIDSVSYSTDYFRFDINEFHYLEDKLEISVEKNLFKKDGLSVNLGSNKSSIKGSLEFIDIQSFPKTLLRPNIMGPFSFVPNMECYHGVVNIHHKIKGSLAINGKLVDFTDGYGYIEKDWGRSFPKWYVWMQSNHFEKNDASLMFSIAKIPWLKRHFTGFISFFYLYKCKNRKAQLY